MKEARCIMDPFPQVMGMLEPKESRYRYTCFISPYYVLNFGIAALTWKFRHNGVKFEGEEVAAEGD